MVRVIIKGGVWRNTEDEILKAAIMKYGKNQWSRIASLLHRKSAKQCKARWYEWLDPGIKKTEWSRDEDEKLLHLAKLMPTQWRTIAPIVGRTAAQCLERYEHLLDEAQKKAENLDDSEDLGDARKLKPGEIDPTPETKPARPDPVDMDEDELEMLSEARARLANTQGKKAKRKAREKQLSEARRLASLQKRRELRAAGIAWGSHKFQRRNPLHIDYNAEIPFEKPVPPGFYDPSEDKFEKNTTFKKVTRAELEGPRRDDVENEGRKRDKELLKKRRSEETPESIFSKKTEKKRSKLVLPAPQISEKEMEEIIKIGQATESVKEMSDENPTSMLLHDYQNVAANSVRTARTPMIHADVIQKEAENLLALHNVPTPLKGGINTPLHDFNMQSALPQQLVAQTPNTVIGGIAATPRSTLADEFTGSVRSSEPGTPATPFRDQLNINTAQSALDNRKQLRDALSQLPAPRNDYEIVAPEEDFSELPDEMQTSEWVEDASEVDARTAEERERARLLQFKKESHARQRNLPIPTAVNELSFRTTGGKTDFNKFFQLSNCLNYQADDLVKLEMSKMLAHDVNNEPVEDFSLEELEDAAKLIENELRPEERVKLDTNLWSVIEQCSSELILSQNKFTRLGVLPKKDQIEALSARFNILRDWMTTRAKKTAKIEKRLKIKLAGYQNIAQNLKKAINEVRTEIDACVREKNTFTLLEQREAVSINKRLSKLTEEVEQQEKREGELQGLYGKLLQDKWEIDQVFVRESATIAAQPVTY
ncbi:unnamed protein product [Enterobius vermicularis]|uniref:Cell division cycle 5-like protein n=1 Tax=Enterobius vermicularis TaxID=51028 RepID=A0A0N4V240_ENTVE|nr:unnamed protein product [Enterobius vermicularis]